MYRHHLSALFFALLAAPVHGSGLTCGSIKTEGHTFDLSKLKGPHSVVTTRYKADPVEHVNMTYTLDICAPLKRSGKPKEGQECKAGTQVCAIKHVVQGDTDMITDVTSIAGSLEDVGGTQFDYEAVRLKTSDTAADAKKEGLRLVLKGGRHPLSKTGVEQKAVIEFLCDRNRTGTEGEWDAEDKYEKGSKLRLRDDKKADDGKEEGDKDNKDDKGDKDGKDKDNKDGDEGESLEEHQLKKKDAALIWNSHGREGDVDVLRLTWYTEYACEKRDDKGGDELSDSAHWGFFTWFIIIAFLGIAAYLVFSSWLNYNRYGARGWDLIPHSDTIRDVPYLFKDWIRRVLNTVQGTGSRGGYSAV